MRNLKKLFAVVLVIAVMLTAMVPAFAEGTTTDISADAKACATLGMLLGGNDGVTYAYTQEEPARIQAAIMLIRLKGLEADAKKATGDNFSDVTAGWMKPYTAYLKANPDLGFSGVGNNKFDPNSKIDAKQYYSVLLTALGYKGDYTWDTVLTKAAEVGLKKLDGVSKVKVADIAAATVEALKTKVKGSDKTLAADLVAKGVFTSDKAVAAGVIAATPTVLTATLSAINLAELNVVFSDAIDKDSVDITKIKVNGVSLIKDTDKTSLSDDKKTLTVYRVSGFTTSQSQTAKISVSGVKTAVGGVTLTEIKDQDVRFVDTAIPTITSVKAVGNKKIEISFSEAIDPTVAASKVYSQYRIDSKAVGGDSTKTPKVDYKTLTINLASSLAAGTHKFNFLSNTLKDYAGFAVVPGDIEFAVADDTSKPTVTVDKVSDQSTLFLRFSKEISLDNGSVYWYNGSIKKAASAVEQDSTDKTLYKVTWGGNYLPLTATTVYVDGYSDYFGNKMDKASLTVTATADTLRPEVKSIVPDPDNGEGALIATFNKDVELSSVQAYGAFIVKDKDSNIVATTRSYKKDSSNKDIKSQIVISGSFSSGTYTIVTKGIKDLSAQADYNKSIEQTFTVSTSDKTGPAWNGVIRTATGNKLVFDFSEAIDAGTASDINNYQFEAAAWGKSNVYTAMPAGVDIAVSTSGKVVTLTFPATISYSGVEKSFATAFADTTNVSLKNIKDVAGNDLPYTIKGIASSLGTAPTLGTARVTDKNTIKIKVTNNFPVEVAASDFKVQDSASTDIPVTGASLNTTDKEIILSLGKDLNSDCTFGTAKNTITVSLNAISLTKDAYDQAITGVAITTFTDEFAPSIVLDSDNATLPTSTDKVTIQFSEELTAIATGSPAAAAFVVRNEKGDLLAEGTDYTIATDTDTSKVILTLIKTYNGYISVALQNNTTVTDTDGNKAKDFDAVSSRANVVK